MSVPALTQLPGKGICTLRTPYTLCHFTTMNNTYVILHRASDDAASAVDYTLNYFITPKGQFF
jgi:hypothetical protein